MKRCIDFHFSAIDEETGEIPVAFVVRKIGSVLSVKHIMAYVAEQVHLDKTYVNAIIFQFTFTA